MKNMPTVNPGEWISIGENEQIDAVVCTIYEKRPSEIEVVYIDDRDRPINEDVKWNGTYWEFIIKGTSGGYADKYSRLSTYVHLLRQGRKY